MTVSSMLDIKICGLKTPASVQAALDQGASHIGFIFFARSPRNIDVHSAAILRKAAQGRAKVVAVTVDASDAELDEIIAVLQPDMLQLHGSETVERLSEIKSRYGVQVIKALAISTAQDIERAMLYRDVADLLLFDAKPPRGAELPGGNGVTFDWSLLDGLDADLNYMLSGGLNAANVAEALMRARPKGLDISSGVECEPGVKDIALINEFFQATHAAMRLVESKSGARQ